MSATDKQHIYGEVFKNNNAVLYKPKRKKYMSLPVDTADAFQSAISDALGGGGTWNKVEGELLFSSNKDKLNET